MGVAAPEKSLATPASSVDAAYVALGKVMTPAEEARFGARNPDTLPHLINVGGIMHHVLSQAGVSARTIDLGAQMGVVHDVGKDELGATNQGVWTPDQILAFRKAHTNAGRDWVVGRWDRFADPWALFLAAYRHHSPLSNETPYSGLLHLLQAVDRAEAFLLRAYVQATGSGLTPEQAMTAWVLNGRPHPLPPIALVDGVKIDLRAHLLPIMEGGRLALLNQNSCRGQRSVAQRALTAWHS